MGVGIVGYGCGYGYGDGYGDGQGDGYGYGDGDSDGYGDGDSDGYGQGQGYGHGSGEERRAFWQLVAHNMSASWVLAEPNAEIKRELIEAMGCDRLYAQAQATTIHTDVDGYGHPRTLLRIPMPETIAGYIQAVRVTCPTTGRVYHLGVDPRVKTCQDAVASTFRRAAKQYHPNWES